MSRKRRVVTLLLQWMIRGICGGWIDPDTPLEKLTTKSFVDGTVYHLVMSDEFNVPNRSFTDGDDSIWTALDKSDDDMNQAGGGSLHFYNSSTIRTTNGMLQIDATVAKTSWNHYVEKNNTYKKVEKYIKSGMLQSWDKFCFTGGIVEFDVILPGDPSIGGLWPSVWMLGNLGRATYEASTNNIWPWSYNKCNRKLQQAQSLSMCNEQNHFGMHPKQGRGATEIDVLEVMTGKAGKLAHTEPSIFFPYIDTTLQVAPGIPFNRPTEGYQPKREAKKTKSGQIQAIAQSWYDDLEFYGNTSLNPFFYGTYLGETKPEEPVTRSKKQAFQADAVGAMHQITPSHFEEPHSFRLEWQPGLGGRLDWFTKAYKTANSSIVGDGKGQDWVKIMTIKDKSLSELMGSQIPAEPSYLIMNIAISSSWGFPFATTKWCKRCFDCQNPECQCNFNPGFCQMLSKNVSMFIDHIRVYQSHNASAHVGFNHTVGCDPIGYPTKEWIRGHRHLYTRQPPFSYSDKGPLKKIKRGGGSCQTNLDCGSLEVGGRGECIDNKCKCNAGFIGPTCLSIDHKNDEKGAYELNQPISLFHKVAHPTFPPFLCSVLIFLISLFLVFWVFSVKKQKQYEEYILLQNLK